MDHFLEKIDTHTLSLLQQGDEKAFDTIFWKYNPRVFHFIHSLLYDKILAEDLTQNVFLKIWERHQELFIRISNRKKALKRIFSQ